MTSPVRVTAVSLIFAATLAVAVAALRVEPRELSPLIIVLTIGAWVSFAVLARAAAPRPHIGALTERALIAFMIAALGTAASVLVVSADQPDPPISTVVASLVFRIAIIAVLTVPSTWLVLWYTGPSRTAERRVTPVEMLRDVRAANGACRRYAEAYDRLATDAQVLRLEGKPLTQRATRQRAEIALRAYKSELDDREPPDRPYDHCDDCRAYVGRKR